MKLTQRVNYILLPIILVVFTLAGLLIYAVLFQLSQQQLQHRLLREINFLQQEVDLELRSTGAVLSEVLNSDDMIDFINTPQLAYQHDTFKSGVELLLRKTRENLPGAEALQVLRADGSPLLAGSISERLGQHTDATTVSPLNPAQPRAEQLLDKRVFMFQAESGEIKFGLLQRFSPRSPQLQPARNAAQHTHIAFLVSEIGAFARMRARLADDLGQQFSLLFTPTTSSSTAPREDPTLPELDASGDMVLALRDPLYQLDLKIPAATQSALLAGARLKLVAMVLALTLFSFFALRLLIRRQIVAPINELAAKVQDSHHKNIRLEPLASEDEVSQLNNAYLTLLKDIHHLAFFDQLTGLANRRNFQMILSRELHGAPFESHQMALLSIDLDNFKRINDQYGHATGDRLLQKFSTRLQECIRPRDVAAAIGENTLARLAGDEFALLLTDTPGAAGAGQVAERILSMFDHRFEVDGISHNIQASIGIAIAPEDGIQAQTVLRNAEAAMYEAKSAGKNRYQFFNRDIASVLERRQKIEKVLDRALEQKALHLVYMPIYNSTELRPIGAEVLLRCPELAAEGIGPDEFIPVAETSGLIKQIDLWVLEQSLLSLNALRDQHGYTGYLAINISAVELHNDYFPRQVEALFHRYNIDPSLIELEITETSLIANDADSIRVLKELKSLGVRLSLDDFGTGYTAFNQLNSYPVDTLKIDRSFVNDIGDTVPQKHSMVDIILTLAQLYELGVIAEGVETAEQLYYLQKSGCNQLQGYFLSMPLGWGALLELMTTTTDQELELATDKGVPTHPRFAVGYEPARAD